MCTIYLALSHDDHVHTLVLRAKNCSSTPSVTLNSQNCTRLQGVFWLGRSNVADGYRAKRGAVADKTTWQS